MNSDDEDEEPVKLTPVRPKDPEFWTVATESGHKKIPHRSSRRLKFLGLIEKTHDQKSSIHRSDIYDLASGPSRTRSRRPSGAEWSEEAMTVEQANTAQEVVKQRKKMSPGQKSLGKKRGKQKKK